MTNHQFYCLLKMSKPPIGVMLKTGNQMIVKRIDPERFCLTYNDNIDVYYNREDTISSYDLYNLRYAWDVYIELKCIEYNLANRELLAI